MHITTGKLVLALLAFAVFAFEGCRQLYRAKNVDRLESEGKITPESAARIRKKPMRLIGWGLIAVGVAFVVKTFLGI